MKNINTEQLFNRIRAVIRTGRKLVFDFDQVIYDQGVFNEELLKFLESEGIPLIIASHGCTVMNLLMKGVAYAELEYENVPMFDDDGMPLMDEFFRPVQIKLIPDDYVLVDDRAAEWARLSGKDNYIQYVFISDMDKYMEFKKLNLGEKQ